MKQQTKTLSLVSTTFAILICSSALTAVEANDIDSYGGFTDVRGEKTGFFHTQQIGGRWWLVTPEGHGFFGIGMSPRDQFFARRCDILLQRQPESLAA